MFLPYILLILLFILLLIVIIINKWEYSLDISLCYSLCSSYQNWCLRSINRSYYGYISAGIGNRIKGVVELLILSLSNNHYPRRWDEIKFFFDLPLEKVNDNNYHFCLKVDLCKMSTKELDLFLFNNNKFNCLQTIWCDLCYHLVSLNIFNKQLYSLGLISNINENNIRKLQLEIQHNILKNVLKLKPKYERIYKYYSFKLKQYDKVIGIHIRTGFGDFDDSRKFLLKDQTYDFISTAIDISKNYNNSKVKWILLSDNSKILNDLTINKSHYIYNPISNRRTYHYRKNRKDDSSFKEILLLSHSDYFIITNQSTFGLISLLWSGKCVNVTSYNRCVKVIGNGVKSHKYPLFNGY